MIAIPVGQLEGRLVPFERGPVGGLEHRPHLGRERLADRPPLDFPGRHADRLQAAAGGEAVPETEVEEQQEAVRKRLGGEPGVRVTA